MSVPPEMQNNLASLNKKSGASSTGKSGTGGLNKIIGGKTGVTLNVTKTEIPNNNLKTTNNLSSYTKSKSTLSFDSKNSSTASFGSKTSNNAIFDVKHSGQDSSGGKNSSSFGGINKTTANYVGNKSMTPGFGATNNSPKPQKTRNNIQVLNEKSYTPDVSANRKSKKSSISLGIIWLPSRKRNKMKDNVYNPNNYDKNYRLKERTPSMYHYMAGDSSDNQTFKNENERDSLMLNANKIEVQKLAPVSKFETIYESNPDISDTNKSDEKQDFINANQQEESKEASGDSNERDGKDDQLENKDTTPIPSDILWDKDGMSDNVDSVYLRPPSLNKARSTASTEEEDCGIKCLYYTLQCCDCVLM